MMSEHSQISGVLSPYYTEHHWSNSDCNSWSGETLIWFPVYSLFCWKLSNFTAAFCHFSRLPPPVLSSTFQARRRAFYLLQMLQIVFSLWANVFPRFSQFNKKLRGTKQPTRLKKEISVFQNWISGLLEAKSLTSQRRPTDCSHSLPAVLVGDLKTALPSDWITRGVRWGWGWCCTVGNDISWLSHLISVAELSEQSAARWLQSLAAAVAVDDQRNRREDIHEEAHAV